MRCCLPALITTSILLGAANAESQITTRIEAVREATEQGAHALAVARADSLVAWAPGHPGVVLARAVALAAAGRHGDAAQAVRVLLRWDARYAQRALQDSALAPVRPLLSDVDLEARVEIASRPIAHGHVWATVEERDLVAEGTAWDPATRSFLVGSLNKNKIAAISTDGEVTDRVPSGSDGLGSVVGIHVDSIRGTLWVTSAPRFDTPSDTTASAAFAFEAATGRFQRKVELPEGPSFPNDLTTGSDGTVYLSESRSGRILVLAPGATEFDMLPTAIPVSAPNGITVSSDGSHLFFSDLDHIRVVSLDDGADWKLQVPDSVNVAGIDGLAFADGALIAHHPLAFWRIARYRLDPAYRRIVGVDLIEKNTPDPRTSTTGEVVGDHYYYIGNGQLDRMNAGTIDSTTMDPIRLYRVPLHLPADEFVAVALSGVDTLLLLDARNLERVAALPVGRNPHEVTTTPDRDILYVADAGDRTVTKVAIRPTPRVAATWRLPDGISVHDVSVGEDGLVWAASGVPATVFALDSVSGAVRRRYPLQRPGSWMVDARGPEGSLVIANLEGGAVTLLYPATGEEKVLEGRTGEIDAITTVDGQEIWSVNYQTGDLTVFDPDARATPDRQYSGLQASRVVFTPDGRFALVVHGGEATVVAYDVTTRARRASVRVSDGPKVIALSPDGRRAYLTHPRGTLTMIDVPSLTVLRSLTLPGVPDGVAVAGGPEPRR